MSNPSLELAARMPWIHATGDSWWLVTGKRKDGSEFRDCYARVVPEWITGVEGSPLFEILLYTGPEHAVAADITQARELMLVYADQPLTAFYEEDQRTIDDAIKARQ